MTDFTVFDEAFKLWVKCLCSTDDALWKAVPKSLLASVGSTLIFHCNYDVNCLNVDKSLPKFYKHAIVYWQELIHTVPETKSEVANQTIWNNRHIKINKRSVFYIKAAFKMYPVYLTNKKMLSFISFLPTKIPRKFQLSRLRTLLQWT